MQYYVDFVLVGAKVDQSSRNSVFTDFGLDHIRLL